ncbi:MAG: ABC transporter permease subunit [Clostridium sp.]
MIFTLIKNELRKIVRRGKTWVVFGLFLLLTVGLNAAFYMSAKDMEYYMSPAGRIESIDREIQWRQRDIKSWEDELKRTPNSETAKSQIEYAKEDLERLNEERKTQEDKAKNGENPNQWKEDLKLEKENHQSVIDNKEIPEKEKEYSKKRLEEIKAIEEAGIKPTQNWEFTPFNNASNFLNVLGMVILVAGIAVFMSDIVSGEATPPTLKFLLVQPISRGKVLISKFVAVVMTVVGMIAGLELLAFGVVGAISGFDSGKMPVMIGQKFDKIINMQNGGYPEMVPIDGTATMTTMSNYILQSFLLQMLFIVACCAFIFLISTLFKSSMITMAVAVVITVATTMASQAIGKVREIAHLIFFNYGSTPQIINGEVAYMYQNANFTMELGIALMVGVIIICPVIAYFVFNKKDILI